MIYQNQNTLKHSTMSIKPIKMGDQIKTVAIERYRASEGVPSIICILTRNIFQVDTFYHQGVGYVYDPQDERIYDLKGLPATRAIIPVVEYTLANIQTYEYGGPVSVKYLPLSKDDYESKILTKDGLNGDVTKLDLVVTCTDSKMQKNSFDVIAGHARKWMDKGGMEKDTKAQYADFLKLWERSVARPMSADEFLAAMQKADLEAAKGTNKTISTPVSQPVARIAPVVQVNELENAGANELPALGEQVESTASTAGAASKASPAGHNDESIDDLTDDGGGESDLK